MRSTNVMEEGSYPASRALSKVGTYAISMAVLPSLVVGTVVTARPSEEGSYTRPASSALSQLGSEVDYRLLIANSVLRFGAATELEPQDVTVSRAPTRLRKLRARVVKRERVLQFSESQQELETWLGAENV